MQPEIDCRHPPNYLGAEKHLVYTGAVNKTQKSVVVVVVVVVHS